MDKEEGRASERICFDQEGEESCLEFTLGRKTYRFKPLDTSSGGMGMLVTDDDTEVLEKFEVGNKIEMKYRTPEDDLLMIFVIRHITQINKGAFKGHYQVGLSL